MSARVKKPKFPKKWRVRLYNGAGIQIDTFIIEDRFEWEAAQEAAAEVMRNRSCDDWTMVPA